MKLLMISRDPAIFDEHSDVRGRMRDYGALFEELHIVVFTDRSATRGEAVRIAEHTVAYPTASASRFMRIWDGYGIAERILKSGAGGGEGWYITAQDPFECGWLGWFLRLQFRRARLQLQLHTDFLSPYFARESLMNRVRVWLAGFLLPRADSIRVVSERIQRSLHTHFGTRISHIAALPIFVDVHRRMPRASDLRTRYEEHDFIVLMASRLSAEKNIGMALKAIRGLTQIKTRMNADKILLLIVGDGPERAKLQLLITRYQLQNNVVLEPWTNDLASYYKTADCFLLTSNYEGYGRTVVEAMHAGLPIIMTDVGLAGEVLHDGKEGVVVPVGDEAALEQSLVALAKDPQERRRLGEAARHTVRSLPTKTQYLENYRALFQP